MLFLELTVTTVINLLVELNLGNSLQRILRSSDIIYMLYGLDTYFIVFSVLSTITLSSHGSLNSHGKARQRFFMGSGRVVNGIALCKTNAA